MARSDTEQLHQTLTDAEHILLLLPEHPHGDVVGAGWAFAHACGALGKKATLAFSDPHERKQHFNFLPAPENITHTLSSIREVVLAFDTTKNPITNVRTVKDKDRVTVYLTPERGTLSPQDFSFGTSPFPFDVIVCLGAQEKESFGALTDHMSDLFYEVPVINIDNSGANDRYGKINIVQVTASSVSEMCADLLEKLSEDVLTESVAQCLLTGVISATDSFQNKNTTPQSLRLASRLMDVGADQQTIIKNLYKTQPLPLLKLWGRVMSKMQWDERVKLVWATITKEDFSFSGASGNDLTYILDKLKENYTAGKIFLLLFQENGSVHGVVNFSRLGEDSALTEQLRATKKNGAYTFDCPQSSLAKAEKEMLALLRK